MSEADLLRLIEAWAESDERNMRDSLVHAVRERLTLPVLSRSFAAQVDIEYRTLQAFAENMIDLPRPVLERLARAVGL